MSDMNRVKLVDAGQFDGRGVSATIARTEIQRALDSGEDAELVLDVARVAPGDADVEAHTLALALDRTDLESLLRADDGDEIGLLFHADELEAVLPGDVEAHGLREKAAVLAMVATGAAAFAGHAAAQPTTDVGGRTAAAAQGMTAQQIWAAAPPAVGAPYAKEDAARAAQLRTPAPFHPATSGGGLEISAPSSSEAGLAAGIALLITGAAFAARGQQRRPVKPA
jgi:hypothetical protein